MTTKYKSINWFLENEYTIYNCSSVKKWEIEPKRPIKWTSNDKYEGLLSWNTINRIDFLKYINYDFDCWGIRTGLQDNNKYIIALDFDNWYKKGGKYIECVNTRKIWSIFYELIKETPDGLFESSTIDNRGVLIEVSECDDLLSLLEKVGVRFQRSGYHLEIFNGGNILIPPSETPDKTTNKPERKRKFFNTNYIYKLTTDSNIYEFIYDYISDYISDCVKKTKIKPSTFRSKKNLNSFQKYDDSIKQDINVIEKPLYIEPFLHLLDDYRGNDYTNWFKIGIAIAKTYKDEGFETFKNWSKNHDGYNENKINLQYKKMLIYEGKYSGLTFNWILSIAKQDNPDKFVWEIAKYYSKIEMDTEEEKYRIFKIEFEENVRKILEPAIWIKKDYKNSWSICNWSDIKHKYKEKWDDKIINKYFDDKDKCLYQGIDFIPSLSNNLNEDENIKIFNEFEGFPYQIKEFNQNKKKLDILLNHLFSMCGDNNNTYNYFIKWIAHSLFNSNKKTGICPVLKGRPGCGKSTVYTILEKLFGKKYCLTTARCDKDFFGQFNWILYKKLLININEAEYSCFQHNMEVFKSLITDNSMTLEEKGKSKITISNYINFLITTNNDKLFSITSDDRRFYIILCSDKHIGKSSYWNVLNDAINDDDAMYSLYKHFETIYNDDKTYNFENGRIQNKTDYQKIIESVDINPTYKFLQSLIVDKNNSNKDYIEITPKDLIDCINSYCYDNKINSRETGNSLKLKMSLLIKNCYIRDNLGKWIYKFSKIKTKRNLKSKGFWEY
jgi:hypothetical protein